MTKTSSSPEPAKAASTESVPVDAAKADRVVRIEGIINRILSLPAPDAQTVIDDEAGNLSAFINEGHGRPEMEATIRSLLK